MSGDKMLAEGHFVQVRLPVDGNGVLTNIDNKQNLSQNND